MAEFEELFLTCRLEGIDDKFDRRTCLLDLDITLGQQKMATTVSITVADPDGAIADKLITHSLQNGGIPILRDPSEGLTPNTQAQPNGGQVADTSMSPARRAFLDLLSYTEGTYNLGDGGYNVITGGGGTFADYKDHPRVYRANVDSDAAGRYQFISTTWDGIKGKAGVSDFSKISQDKGAIALIGELGHLAEIDAGQIQQAIEGLRPTWASLPGASQDSGKSMAECLTYYNQRLAMYNGGAVPEAKKTSPQEQQKTGVATGQAPTVDPVVKGNRLIVQWGDQLFEFFHQGTDYDWLNGKTTISGVGIRWVLNRRPRNKTFEKKTFREIAQTVAQAQGLKLDYQATYDVYYEYVSQDGISDYQLLVREAERAGLVVSETSTTLVVKSLQNLQDTSIVLQFRENVISLVSKDVAVDSTTQDFGTWTTQTVGSKVDIDALTGKMVQSKPDIDPAKGAKDVTGQSAKQPTGKLAPGTEKAVDQAQAKWKRVRGLPTTVVIPLTNESLGIQPMQAVRTRGFTSFLNRVWVVDQVSHSYGGATTTLQLYTAVSVKDESTMLSYGAPGSQGLPIGAGTFMYPVHNIEVTDLVGYSESRGRMHMGTDIGCAEGTPVQASADGTVICAEVQSGYGNIIRIDHGNGLSTGYAHLSQMNVRVQQQVKKGDVIGLSGNTGIGTGPHLHWEIRKGDPYSGQALTPPDVGLPPAIKNQNTP